MSLNIYQRSFSAEPLLIRSLFNLLDTSFPGISQANLKAEQLGPKWEQGSTPFILFQNEKAVSHVGVLTIPVCFQGKNITVAGIHAVCTRPEYRRRGLFRQVMKEALHFADQHFENNVLFTSQPELYLPFGFRVVQEYMFQTKVKQKKTSSGLRPLDLKNPEDLCLLHQSLETRKPISNTFGIGAEKGLFCFNESSRPLFYWEAKNLLVSMQIEKNRLNLFDIVGSNLCALSDLVENINQPIEEATIYFNPDQLNTEAKAEPIVFESDSFLMTRGTLPFEKIQFMWPRSARC